MSEKTTEPKLYSPKQVAALLGLQVRTVREYLHSGELAYINVGKKDAVRPTMRIPADALAEFLEQRKANTKR